ncbi:hypothetical protein GGTG_12821 [Gaeumannomyces tritici R3-111a-1]|uniref:Uncharacterized protein n=1 Tax=Gaeumannomyces tritici (strain R3-111a-1) TaxID=644352 RepID=J3PH41_GAET3|nr:hypothetical protein GGTG_12821 [Gaeumannomyces tritici R3-111a-1]EJT69938.1 hypothetical protein GGTG_12821 [Gaeumannomyces tritici R3-111a-1]
MPSLGAAARGLGDVLVVVGRGSATGRPAHRAVVIACCPRRHPGRPRDRGHVPLPIKLGAVLCGDLSTSNGSDLLDIGMGAVFRNVALEKGARGWGGVQAPTNDRIIVNLGSPFAGGQAAESRRTNKFQVFKPKPNHGMRALIR